MDDTSWIYIVIPTVMAFLMGTVALVIRMRASKKNQHQQNEL